jgi:hypothetical protein
MLTGNTAREKSAGLPNGKRRARTQRGTARRYKTKTQVLNTEPGPPGRKKALALLLAPGANTVRVVRACQLAADRARAMREVASSQLLAVRTDTMGMVHAAYSMADRANTIGKMFAAKFHVIHIELVPFVREFSLRRCPRFLLKFRGSRHGNLLLHPPAGLCPTLRPQAKPCASLPARTIASKQQPQNCLRHSTPLTEQRGVQKENLRGHSKSRAVATTEGAGAPKRSKADLS